MDRTLALLKPDAVQRELWLQIIVIYLQAGLRIVQTRMMTMSHELAEELYAEHRTRDTFDQLVAFTASGPVIALLIEGEDAIQTVRRLNSTIIRPMFAETVRRNCVHGSDSPKSAKWEIALFFGGLP